MRSNRQNKLFLVLLWSIIVMLVFGFFYPFGFWIKVERFASPHWYFPYGDFSWFTVKYSTNNVIWHTIQDECGDEMGPYLTQDFNVACEFAKSIKSKNGVDVWERKQRAKTIKFKHMQNDEEKLMQRKHKIRVRQPAEKEGSDGKNI